MLAGYGRPSVVSPMAMAFMRASSSGVRAVAMAAASPASALWLGARNLDSGFRTGKLCEPKDRLGGTEPPKD